MRPSGKQSNQAPNRSDRWQYPNEWGESKLTVHSQMPVSYLNLVTWCNRHSLVWLTSSSCCTSLDARLTMRPIEMLPTVPWLSDNIYRSIKASYTFTFWLIALLYLLVSCCCESDAGDHTYLVSNQKCMTKYHHKQNSQHTQSCMEN